MLPEQGLEYTQTDARWMAGQRSPILDPRQVSPFGRVQLQWLTLWLLSPWVAGHLLLMQSQSLLCKRQCGSSDFRNT